MPVQDNGLYDLRKTERWVVSLLLAIIVGEVLLAAHTALFLNFLAQIQVGTGSDGSTLDLIGGAVGVYYFIVYFGCVIASGMWIYRAAHNARQISGQDDISAGWAVGWFFVPIANLWKPFQEMKRVWMESTRDDTPGYFGLWWAAWIGTNILANISMRMWARADDASEMEVLSYIDLVAVCLGITSAWMFRRIVKTITEAQRPAYEGTTGPVAAVFE